MWESYSQVRRLDPLPGASPAPSGTSPLYHATGWLDARAARCRADLPIIVVLVGHRSCGQQAGEAQGGQGQGRKDLCHLIPQLVPPRDPDWGPTFPFWPLAASVLGEGVSLTSVRRGTKQARGGLPVSPPPSECCSIRKRGTCSASETAAGHDPARGLHRPRPQRGAVSCPASSRQ